MIRSLPAIPFFFMVAIFTGMAGVAIYVALRTRARANVMAATPTSNVGFATDGYVEFEGQAQAVNGHTIPAPLTGAACVWYHARLEHWRRGQGKDTHDWVRVRDATSGDPFLLKDSTGTCIVFPYGAEMTFTDRSVWFGSTPIPEDRNPPKTGPGDAPEGAMRVYGVPGQEYRYTEERIYAGDPLYALGQFSTEKWEEEDDEEIADDASTEDTDAEEEAWDFFDREEELTKAATALTSRRLMRPASQPYLLSTTPQAKLQTVYGQGWKGSLFVAIVPAAIAIGLLWLRYA